MMYKLFRNGTSKVLLDMSYDKKDIEDTLADYMNCFLTIDYSIVKNENYHDEEIAIIKSMEDYVNFKCNNKVLRLKR